MPLSSIKATVPLKGHFFICKAAKASKNLENAILWTEFWTREDVQLFFANGVAGNAALQLSDTSLIEDPMARLGAETLFDAPVIYDWGGIATEVYTPTVNEMVKLMLGDITIEEQITNLETIIADYKTSVGK